jgi:hypothetical protein
LPKETQDAYYQLILYPVEACANMNEMYVAAAKNRLYRMQDRASTNFYADKVKQLFFKDADFTAQHNTFADGKWNHIMEQTHMGHVTWSDPRVNKMPEVSYVQVPASAALGYVLESSTSTSRWNRGGLFAQRFSPFDPINDQHYFIEVFNTGSEKLNYSIVSKNDWIKLSSESGSVQFDEKIDISIAWDKVPAGQTEGEVILSDTKGRDYTIKIPLHNVGPAEVSGFIENRGIVSIDAANFQNKKETKSIRWEIIPNLGLNTAAITTTPVTSRKQSPGANSPFLEYKIFLIDSGTFNLEGWFSPSLNFQKDEGLMYAFSIDDGEIKMMNLHEEAKAADWTYPKWWNDAVTHNLMKQTVLKKSLSAGEHTIKYYVVDPGLVLQKILLIKEGVNADSYLGPPQSVKK